MLEQGVHFMTVAPNIIVKFPATSVGIDVMEEATYRGVSVNCTVSFSVAQAVAAAEAVERGLVRREREGLPTDNMGPVITIMVGRIEDWLKVLVERDGIIVHPAALAYSGVAVFKRAYRIFQERGFRARLLAAAIRHHLHWSEFIGGDVVITLPSRWQKQFNASTVEVRERMADPVDPEYIAELSSHFADFRRAYEPDGLADRRVRHLRAQRAHAALLHRQLPRPARSGDRRPAAQSRPAGLTKMFVVAAYWRAREGEAEACAAILRTMAQLSVANEPGCRMFAVHQAVEEPRDFFLYEQYDDEDAFKAHAQTDYFKQHVLGDAVPRLEQRSRTFYTSLD